MRNPCYIMCHVLAFKTYSFKLNLKIFILYLAFIQKITFITCQTGERMLERILLTRPC